jgi:hypothetical protein
VRGPVRTTRLHTKKPRGQCLCVGGDRDVALFRRQDARNAATSLPNSGRVAPAVKVGVSFHPLSVRTLGTQAAVLQPDAIAKLTSPAWLVASG